MEQLGDADKVTCEVPEECVDGKEQDGEGRDVHGVQDLAEWCVGVAEDVREHVASGLDSRVKQAEGQDGDGLQQEGGGGAKGGAGVETVQGAVIPGQAEVADLRSDTVQGGT
jgi:hypothetical protein